MRLRTCIATLSALSAVAPATPVGAQPVVDSLTTALANRLDSAARANHFSGVILLARNGVRAWSRAYGFADFERRTPNTEVTRFNVSSVGKLFTQVAIAQLADRGLLDLSAPVGTWLPSYANADVAKQVTIPMLLTHKSGLQGDVLQPSWLPKLNRNHDYLAEFERDAPAFPPGSRQEYSNAGFVLLGEIIERVSREDFYDYLSAHLFTPAGMTATAYDRQDTPSAGRATGVTHYLDPGGDRKTDDARPSAALQPNRGSAAGGAYSTADDLLRFVVARRSGGIPNLKVGGPARMLGGSAGFNSVVFEGIRPGYDLIILANLDPPAASDLLDVVLKAGPGAPR